MTAAVEWEEPPPPTAGGRPREWADRLDPLRERPGQWARVSDMHTHASVRSIVCGLRGRNRGRRPVAGVDPTEWEFRFGRMPEESSGEWWAIWARYVGGGDE